MHMSLGDIAIARNYLTLVHNAQQHQPIVTVAPNPNTGASPSASGSQVSQQEIYIPAAGAASAPPKTPGDDSDDDESGDNHGIEPPSNAKTTGIDDDESPEKTAV